MAREWRARARAVPRSLWTAMVALVLAVALSFPLQRATDDDAALVSAAAGRALAAFAIARAINGIVSVAQSSEVGATFVVSGSVGVGQILDRRGPRGGVRPRARPEAVADARLC